MNGHGHRGLRLVFVATLTLALALAAGTARAGDAADDQSQRECCERDGELDCYPRAGLRPVRSVPDLDWP